MAACSAEEKQATWVCKYHEIASFSAGICQQLNWFNNDSVRENHPLELTLNHPPALTMCMVRITVHSPHPSHEVHPAKFVRIRRSPYE
jgi:hypothetical protein